jgi:hypothetical protein
MFQVITLARPAGGSLMGSPFGVASTTIGQYNTRTDWWQNPGGPEAGHSARRRGPTKEAYVL